MYIRRIFFAIVMSGILISAMFSYFVYRIMFKSNTKFQSDFEVLYIKTNTSNPQLLNKLDSLLINVNDFKILAKQKKYVVRPGKYIISRNMNNNQIINILRSENTTVNVLVNNVKNLNDLAGKVSKQLELDSLELLNSFDDDLFFKNGFDKENRLAMYIPNSYNFYWNTNANDFNLRMLSEHNKFWNINRKEKLKKVGLNKIQVMILASIINQESKKESELPTIAGVYFNRLKNNWKLQADPTVIYAAYKLDEYKNTVIRRVLNKHLKIDSPYNTYKYFGLPPGLISMPTVNSIDAVLNYEKHNYFFFAADPSRPGFHSFATTFSQHKKNAKKYHYYLNSRNIKK